MSEIRAMRLPGDRLMAKVEVAPNGCWVWTGGTSDGYGRMSIGSKVAGTYRIEYTHRVSYEIARGEIPAGFVLDHLCRNRACCNPDHLEVVTNSENILRGISGPAQNARATHCAHGHEFTEANTSITRQGRRKCRACHRQSMQESRARMKERA